jgi:hypothetical protein
MIPGAFGSEITKIPPINEVLRRYNHFSGRSSVDFTTNIAKSDFRYTRLADSAGWQFGGCVSD